MTSLQKEIAAFYKTPEDKVRVASIVSDDAYDGVLDVFEAITNTKIERCAALDGVGYLTNHPDFPRLGLIDEEKMHTIEEVARTLSYIDLFRECIDMDVEVLLAVSEATISTIPKTAFLGAARAFLKDIEHLEMKFDMTEMRDILLFGSEPAQTIPVGKYVKVASTVKDPVPFFCITREAMRRCISLHTFAVRKGRVASLEELFTTYLQAERKQILTPFQDAFFARVASLESEVDPIGSVVDEESDNESD